MDIAVLGMGRMGQALARRLLRGGHQVTVWNRTKGAARDIVSVGVVEAPTVTDAVHGVDVVVTMLSDDAAVRAVALGELRSSIGSTTSYADCSTISPTLSDELAERFPDRFVAMPIMGGPAAVVAGHATLLVGGDGDVVDRLSPMISSLSDTVRRYDTASLAITAKLTSNLLLLSGVVGLAESVAVGRCGGLSDDQLRDLLGARALAPGLQNRFDSVLAGSHSGWWTTVLAAKDAGLALGIAHAAEVELPMAAAVRHLYAAAASSGLNDADIAAVTNLYRSAGQAPGRAADSSSTGSSS
ncbi:NAD(P)-dependent oxidoreductase [Nocardia sp. NPDC049190]|uniref:NAD(P)-dependent oxidoreductase n=1 Tax=Nocardia sp. NPDC049190 TaxID=3155650 RepID=UPI0033FC65E8